MGWSLKVSPKSVFFCVGGSCCVVVAERGSVVAGNVSCSVAEEARMAGDDVLLSLPGAKIEAVCVPTLSTAACALRWWGYSTPIA